MLQWLFAWTNITFSAWTTMAVILVIFGVLCTFFGYRLLRFLIAFQGFLIGCMASLLIFSQTTELAGVAAASGIDSDRCGGGSVIERIVSTGVIPAGKHRGLSGFGELCSGRS